MSVRTGNHAMFLPNRRGILKRDNDLRAKAHRMALDSVQGDVNTQEPLSMQFSRGQKADMKKLQQQAARSEYVEKCNRKLVDKMMMIMQGLCGTILSEQTFPDFNPGTLNYRIRQRELLRIDRANSALLHRLETTSSGYNKALVKPKHFQEPHMGLFPRSEQSVKSAGSRPGKRTRPLGSSTAPSAGGTVASQRGRGRGNRQLGWDASVTSVLTEGSAFPTTTLGRFQDASSGGGVSGPPLPRQGGGQREAVKPRSGSPGGPDGGGSVDTISGLSRTPHPPSISSRATCGSTSGRVPSALKRCRRLAKTTPAKPGATVFRGGIRVGDEYALLTVTRATEGFGEDGSQGFLLKAYFPMSLAVHTVGIAAANLPAFTAGSRTAVRQLFQSGEKSRRRWERVIKHLELRPWNDSSMQNPVEETQRVAGPESDSPGRAEKMGADRSTATTASAAGGAESATSETAAAATAPAADSLGMLEGAEDKGGEAPATPAAEAGATAATAATAMGPGASTFSTFEMVLVPPHDAPVLIIQRLVRGRLMRETYKILKRAIIVIQAAIRGWKYRMAKRQYEAATKIAAVTRGKRGRNRVKQERAARGIQKHTRSWLRKRNLEKEKAAKQIQRAVRRRHEKLRRERKLAAREESLFLYEQPTPETTTAMRGGGRAPGRRHGQRKRPVIPNNKRRLPGVSKATKSSGSSTSSSINSSRHIAREEGSGGGMKVGRIGVSEGGVGAGKAACTPPRNQRPRPPDAKDFTRKGTHDVEGRMVGRNDHTGVDSRVGGISVIPPPLPKSSAAAPRVAGAWPSGGAGTRTAKAAAAAAGTAITAAEAAPKPAPDSQKGSGKSSPRSASGGNKGRARRPPVADGKQPELKPAPDHLPQNVADDKSSSSHIDGDGNSAELNRQRRSSSIPWVEEAANGKHSLDVAGDKSSSSHIDDAGTSAELNRQRRSSSIPWVEEAANGKHLRDVADDESSSSHIDGGGNRAELNRRRRSSSIPWVEEAANGKHSLDVAGDKSSSSHIDDAGTSAELNRQRRSSSIPWVEEAANGKHLRDVADDESSSSHIDGGGNRAELNRRRRSSSIPWVEEAANGKHFQPPSQTKTTVEPAFETLTGRTSPDGTVRISRSSPSPDAGQHGGSNTASGGGTSETKPASAPQEVAESAPSKQTAARQQVAMGSHQISIDNSGGENSSAPNRRTSSISWADDIVARTGDNGASSLSPKAAALTVSRPADGNGDGHGSGLAGDGDNSAPNRRTSSISWAEDIVARTRDNGASPSSPKAVALTASRPADGNGIGLAGDGDNSAPNRRTSSISWAEDIVARTGEAVRPRDSAAA
eukprot:g6158.t1